MPVAGSVRLPFNRDTIMGAIAGRRYGMPVEQVSKSFKVPPNILRRADQTIGPAWERRAHSNLNPTSGRFRRLDRDVEKQYRKFSGRLAMKRADLGKPGRG